MSTLGNVFGKTSREYGGSKNIWHEVKGQFPVGGKITNADDFKGNVIPSGSMCKYDEVKAEVTIVKASEVKTATQPDAMVEPSSIRGLLYHDVYVETELSNTYATGAVVFAGEIYIDRLAEEIPAEVLAVLPMIVPIHEKQGG